MTHNPLDDFDALINGDNKPTRLRRVPAGDTWADGTPIIEPPDYDTPANTDPPGNGGPIEYTDWHHLLTAPPQPTNWHARPLLAAGRVTLLYSPGKTGKSLIAMEIAVAAALGRPTLASEARDPATVLYIDQEMTPEDWRDRITQMGVTAHDAPALQARLHLAQLQPWLAMDTIAGGAIVAAETARIGADVVIIDTASKVSKGEENSNDTHQAFYRCTVVPLKRAGIGVLVLDHTGKDLDRGARGGSAKTDNVDLAFELLTRGRDLLALRCSHARFRDEMLQEPLLLRRQNEPILRHEIQQNTPAGESGTGDNWRPVALMHRVSAFLEANPGMSKNSIETGVRGKREYVRMALDLLLAEGFVKARPGGNGGGRCYDSLIPYNPDEGDDETPDDWHKS